MKARGFEPLNSFLELPHVKIGADDLKGRRVPITGVYNDEGWHYWAPRPNGTLQPLMAVPVEALYFGTTREHPEDFYFDFLNFIFQVASFAKAVHWSQCILDDLHNLGSSLAKLRTLFQNQSQERRIVRMAATELEYIFISCRSLFDLLQETIAALWPLIAFKGIPDKRPHLPTSFAKMVLREKTPMTAEQIAERFKMPAEFGVAYAENPPSFYHGLENSETVLLTMASRSKSFLSWKTVSA